MDYIQCTTHTKNITHGLGIMIEDLSCIDMVLIFELLLYLVDTSNL